MALTTKRLAVTLILFAGLVLAGCSPASSSSAPAATATTSAPAGGGEASEDTRTDAQGAVTVAVTPVNLAAPGETLDFSVALDTHSVDLGMDLAALATLATDDGRTVQAVTWTGAKGGHHVEGTLSFPAKAGGKELTGGASTLTLTLKGVDAPERVFEWSLK